MLHLCYCAFCEHVSKVLKANVSVNVLKKVGIYRFACPLQSLLNILLHSVDSKLYLEWNKEHEAKAVNGDEQNMKSYWLLVESNIGTKEKSLKAKVFLSRKINGYMPADSREWA